MSHIRYPPSRVYCGGVCFKARAAFVYQVHLSPCCITSHNCYTW